MEITPVKREKLYTWIIQALTVYEELTAREIADYLHKHNVIPLAIRQATAPRCTELVHAGRIEVCGSKIDESTHKRVSIYSLRGDE